MSKGGATKTTSTVTQSNLPEYARPYFERLMGRAEGVTNAPYVPYQDQRVAGFGSDTEGYFSGVRDLSADFAPAADLTNTATQAAVGATYDPTDFSVDQWGNAAAERYMNPYMSQVFDVTRQRADQQFAQDQITRNTRQQRAGAFGGSRRFVENALAKQAHDLNLQEMEAKALADAYGQAYSMFGADRSAAFGADQATEQSKQFGADFGQKAAQIGLAGAKQLAGLEEAGFKLDAQQLGMLKDQGIMQDALRQRMLDVGYEDFINQRDYERQNLGFLSGILRGVPVSPQSSVVQYQPSANPFSQLAGLGMGIYGLQQAQQTAGT